MPGRCPVDRNALRPMRDDASAEVRLMDDADALMLTEPEFVETKTVPRIEIDSADLDVYAQRAGVQ